MAATVNANANANAALSSPSAAGESIGSPQTPSRRTYSGAAGALSPPWNKIIRAPEIEGTVDPPLPPPVSLVTAAAPTAAGVVHEQNGVRGKGGSSTEGSEGDTQVEGSDNGNGPKKGAWSKPHNAAPETDLVISAVSWPTLSESTKASPKPPSLDFSKDTCEAPISAAQVTATNISSAPQKQITSNPNIPIPNATQPHGRPVRQKPMKREGGLNSSPNGDFSHPFPQSGPVGNTPRTNINSSLKAGSGGSENAGREHGHSNATRDGGQRSGGDHPQQRNYRRGNGGPHIRGDGSFGGRRDQHRGIHDWNHHRSFNGRDSFMSQQRAGPGGIVRPPPPPPAAAAASYVPLPLRPYGVPVGIPPEMQPIYYFAPHPGMPYFPQTPPAVYSSSPDPQLHVKIINQIDYYFSNENLVKDTYLRKNMDEHGWVPVQLIANFKKVMQLTTDIQLILDALQASTVVEVQGDRVRRRADWMRWIMPPSAQFPSANGSQPPRMLQETLPARVQGLALDEKAPSGSNSKSQVDAQAGIRVRSSSGDMNSHSETSKDGGSLSAC